MTEKQDNPISSLYRRILSEENIYSAIFCMDTYSLEKGLLDTELPVKGMDGGKIAGNDLELYYALSDKYDTTLIESVTAVCQDRLKRIFADPKDLFEVSVFFRMKDLDEKGKITFRPMHTARLTDLICMISILNCLMFEDTDTRHLSDLSKLIPHNFYGNIPSTDVQRLYENWHGKYKEYNNAIIQHRKEYRESRRYLTEVDLDIKNFFPSVSPMLMYDFAMGKTSGKYDETEMGTLGSAVSKLLFLKLKQAGFKPWGKDYYGKNVDPSKNGYYMTRGLPQGLPQSYFFGNLCMTEIVKLIMDKKCFPGDGYFYVDDSVIFVEPALDSMDLRIKRLNEYLVKFCGQSPNHISDIDPDDIEFQRNLNYTIQFHENGKSSFSRLDSDDSLSALLNDVQRQTSMTSLLMMKSDEAEDIVSLKKIDAIIKLIDLKIIDERGKKDRFSLKRWISLRKYFTGKKSLLEIGMNDADKNKYIDEFLAGLSDPVSLGEWFFKEDNDIFMRKYQYFIRYGDRKKAEIVFDAVKKFELEHAVGNDMDKTGCLFYTKDAGTVIRIRDIECSESADRRRYKSVLKWIDGQLGACRRRRSDDSFNRFRSFIGVRPNTDGIADLNDIVEGRSMMSPYSSFVARNSTEFKRKIINAYFSSLVNVRPSDSTTFIKVNGRNLNYYEFRVLAWLRSGRFSLSRFEEFMRELDENDISNKMDVDMALVGTIDNFSSYVRDPKLVDNLILTHQITAGLWSNGSKYLHSYTLHNERHAVNLVDSSIRLTKIIDCLSLESYGYYILFLSCYMHDISMVIDPDQYVLISKLIEIPDGENNDKSVNERNVKMLAEGCEMLAGNIIRTVGSRGATRKTGVEPNRESKFLLGIFNEIYGFFEERIRTAHAGDSAKYICDKSSTLFKYIEPPAISYVAKLSESHGFDDTDKVYKSEIDAGDRMLGLRKMMILLRLADLSDVAEDRVNYHNLVFNLDRMDPTSKFHWISHLVTDRMDFMTDYEPKDGENGQKHITETLNIDLKLNVRDLTPEENTAKCESCQCCPDLSNNRISVLIMDGRNGEKEAPNHRCDCPQCLFLCKWMMHKHSWLIKELVALKSYLNPNNRTMFKTEIKFNILYSDTMPHNQALGDNIRKYLSSDTNMHHNLSSIIELCVKYLENIKN